MPDHANDRMTAAEFNAMHTGSTSEREQQKALVQWAAAKAAERPSLRMLFHVPMGGNRSAASGARMKALGAKAGVPDLCLPVPRCGASVKRYGALWIEMKAEGGRLRKKQRWWREALRDVGHAHAVCRSWTDARDVLLSYLDGQFEGAESTR